MLKNSEFQLIMSHSVWKIAGTDSTDTHTDEEKFKALTFFEKIAYFGFLTQLFFIGPTFFDPINFFFLELLEKKLNLKKNLYCVSLLRFLILNHSVKKRNEKKNWHRYSFAGTDRSRFALVWHWPRRYRGHPEWSHVEATHETGRIEKQKKRPRTLQSAKKYEFNAIKRTKTVTTIKFGMITTIKFGMIKFGMSSLES